MFIFRTLEEYPLRKLTFSTSEKSARLTSLSRGLNDFNIDYTARSISAVVKATTLK